MSKLAPSRGLLAATISFAFILSSCGGGGGGAAPNAPDGGWIIPANQVVDGGPGKNGIPSIDSPVFEPISQDTDNPDSQIVIGIRYNGETKAYPHAIMNHHEIVNDGRSSAPYVLHYCPLTGSAMAWEGDPNSPTPSFGVSGLLYKSNLILYDRASDSNWSQMLEQSVQGRRVRELPQSFQVIETTKATWEAMFPNSEIMTRATGYTREYDFSPYGSYNSNDQLLFPPASLDVRLHMKERVLGIRSDNAAKAYQVSGFGPLTQTINEQFDGQDIVVVGNSNLNFAVSYNRRLSDGTILNFTPLQDDLPNVMQDDEGNVWDIFGIAVSGPRAGTELERTRSYIAMWFAWADFYPNSTIHFN